jgi:N-acetylmuramoyl-L-alanine amidase
VKRRDALQRLGGLVLLLGANDIAFGATIVAVRVWPSDDYTRVTIESDTKLAARHTLVDGPPRLVVDIDGLVLSPQLREIVGKVQADDPYIAGVRVGQNQPDVVRVVVDLKQPIAPQQFALEPVAAYRHRLVFDLRPTQERDPLLALIHEKEQAERDAAQAVQDALGDFIGRIDGARPPGPLAAAPSMTPKSGPAA